MLKQCLKTFCVMIGIYFLAMILVYLIPDKWLAGNINNGIEYIENKEGRWVSYYFETVGSTTDSWTDISEMGNNLINEGDMNVVERAMDNGNYARYWHGNHIIIRILFVFFTYVQMRYISQFVIIGSISIVFSLIWKKIDIGIASMFLVSIVMSYPFTIGMSLQYIIPFMVMIAGLYYILVKYKENMETGLYFFMIGSIINFFDLLTFPLASLLMPLVIALIFRIRNDKCTSGGRNFAFLIKSSLLWTLGYAATWFSKWVLATLILRKNIFFDAMESVLLRSGDDGGQIDRLEAVTRCFNTYFKVIPKLTYFVVLIIIIILGFFSVKYRNNLKRAISRTWPFLTIAIIPNIWVFVLANHSYLHYGFVYRIYMGAAFAIGGFIVEYIRIIKEPF